MFYSASVYLRFVPPTVMQALKEQELWPALHCMHRRVTATEQVLAEGQKTINQADP